MDLSALRSLDYNRVVFGLMSVRLTCVQCFYNSNTLSAFNQIYYVGLLLPVRKLLVRQKERKNR